MGGCATKPKALDDGAGPPSPLPPKEKVKKTPVEGVDDEKKTQSLGFLFKESLDGTGTSEHDNAEPEQKQKQKQEEEPPKTEIYSDASTSQSKEAENPPVTLIEQTPPPLLDVPDQVEAEKAPPVAAPIIDVPSQEVTPPVAAPVVDPPPQVAAEIEAPPSLLDVPVDQVTPVIAPISEEQNSAPVVDMPVQAETEKAPLVEVSGSEIIEEKKMEDGYETPKFATIEAKKTEDQFETLKSEIIEDKSVATEAEKPVDQPKTV